MNILKITPKIYVSGCGATTQKDELQALGITAVLFVAWETPAPIYESSTFQIVKIGLLRDKTNKPQLKALAVIALKSLLDAGHIVLVAGEYGTSRPPYVVLRYLSEKEGNTMEALYQEFRTQYPQITISDLNYE